MNFEDELRNEVRRKAREEEIRKAALEEVKVQEQRRRWELNSNLVRDAQKISTQKIEPYLITVNKVCANGKGKIDKPYLTKDGGFELRTSLSWGCWSNSYGSEGGNIITFNIDIPKREILWRSTGSVYVPELGESITEEACLKIDSPDFDTNMKNLLKKIASNKNYHYYHEVWNDYQN